jgi:hypothetical protein
MTAMTDQLREQLALELGGEQAHMSFAEAVADFPEWAINERAPNVSYTPWHLIEHLRITQWDMLEYIKDPTGHVSPEWPVGYWPAHDARTDARGFALSVVQFVDDLGAMQQIALDGDRDLMKVLEGTPGHTLLRCLMLIGNHNSYHIGEFASLRQVMGSWPKGRPS